ncbi:MAG: hypothetical protein IJA67_12560 [Oscillospiraceae bacterium]|nr:hypothetical protein [Oscillospiraceae bacterium]
MTYTEFKKLKIDTSPIGWEPPSKNDIAYLCTPKGAKIIGRAGVDGIHYCTVRSLGETVFAVSPMNLPGQYVHPIARNMEDLLRLLLACLDMNLIEQAWAWDEEQLTEQIEEVRNSEYFDPAPLNAIREKCGLKPMEKPFEYLYRLQRSFNYGSIPFTKEYYDTIEESTEWTPPTWKVTMDGDFFPERGKGGKEIPLNKSFKWGGETWHIPSAYLCSGGVVVDFFAEVDTEKFLAFRKESEDAFSRGRSSAEDEEQFHRMNPSSINFRPSIVVNGTELPNKSGHGDAWYPESCRDEGTEEDARAKYLVERYGFDFTRIWIIRRCTFPSEAKIEKIASLSLKMVRSPETFSGIHFTAPKVGNTFDFTHPVHGTEHTLSVVEYEADEIDQSKFASDEWIFPTHMTAMKYAVSPDLPREEVSVRDCRGGDSPRRKTPDPNGGHMFASAVGMIRSTDGPTAVTVGVPQAPEVHTACSGLYFEKQDFIEWRMSFRVKTVEDLDVEIL